MSDTRRAMAFSEHPTKTRADSKSGLRVLVRRSRRALHLLSQALKEAEQPDPGEATGERAGPPLNEQITEALELTQNLHTRFALLEQRLAILSEKVELLTVRGNEPPRRLEGEGTLRPPKVPQGLDVPIDASASASNFNAHTFATSNESRQHSGFDVRAASGDNLRAARNTGAGPLLSGHITGLSLSSLFSLFEFERSSGSLTIQHRDRRLDLLLRGGRVVRCELDGVRSAATSSVREAFAWTICTFSFRRDPEQEDVEPPQSVNALMLDAMRYHDEELRTG